MKIEPGRTGLWALVVLLVMQGVGGIGGGLYLVLDPDGGLIGLPLEWLEGSPFPDYLIPGITLVTILGIFPIVVAVAILQQKRWGIYGSIVVGAGLIIWMVVELLVVGYQSEPPLQVIFGCVGVAILLLGWRESTR